MVVAADVANLVEGGDLQEASLQRRCWPWAAAAEIGGDGIQIGFARIRRKGW